MTCEHILRAPSCSMEKAKRLLGFAPHYTSMQAVKESLKSMIERGIVK